MTDVRYALPVMSFGREICGDLNAGFRREWLVTNGIGGYASGALLGVSSRSYHGLLVASLQPPVARTVLVGSSVEQATYQGRRYWISTNEYADGVFAPDGYRNLMEFRLEGSLPVWTYSIADALVERRLWMVHGKNTTYVSFRVLRANGPVDLEITPLVTYRDHHTLTSGQGWHMQVEAQKHGATDHAFEGATPLRMLTDSGDFRPTGRWYWNFRYREEGARGLNDHGDLYAPGSISQRLETGELLTIVYTAEADAELDGARTLAAEQARQHALLVQADAVTSPPLVQHLVLAADQFIVERGHNTSGHAEQKPRKSVIAGYHWFTDWGRDTMIALPGLTLTTGRGADAENIFRSFAEYLADGLLPNNFPEREDAQPGYNTVDATLWFVVALDAYRRSTKDEQLLRDLLPKIVEIVDHFINGTRYGISVDSGDGLLRAGEEGTQLTWMDALVDGWVVTPRQGKPVEVNALWYNALRIVSAALRDQHDDRATTYEELATQVQRSFVARFTHEKGDYLADVIDGPTGDDWSLRPNQIFALSLPYPLVEGDLAKRVLGTIGRSLFTTYGLRSLGPKEPAYVGTYGGDRRARDGAYHQGTVWAWLIGAYAETVAKLTGDKALARSVLEPFIHHLRDAGLGTISEIFDGDAPHTPRGAIAQAWSVAEVLRVWRALEE